MSVLILLVVGREQKIENLKPQASLFLGSLPKFILTTWSGSSPHSSVGKGSTCNAGDPNSIPVSGRSPGEGIGYPLQYSWPSLVVKESACNVRDLGSIPGLGRSSGEGKGYPLQYSGLENSVGCKVHGVARNQTRRVTFTFTFIFTGSLKPRIYFILQKQTQTLSWGIFKLGF